MSHDATRLILRDIRSAAMWAASLTASELASHHAAHSEIEVTVKGGFRGLHAAVTRCPSMRSCSTSARTLGGVDGAASA